MHARRRLHSLTLGACLAAALLAAAPLAAQAPEAATIATAARGARLDRAHTRSASIDGKRFDITPADFSGIRSVEQIRAGIFLGVLDNEAGAAEDVSLPTGRFNLYLTQSNGALVAYAEQSGKVYPAKRTIQKPEGPPNDQPQFRRGSGCWWLWLIFTGIEVCW
jgi:hypothetical protein